MPNETSIAAEMIADGQIVLHGEVGGGFWGSDGFDARGVIAALAQLGPGPVTVRLNSGGGDPMEGAAIHAALKAHPGEVTVRIEGVAASAASLLAMAGARIVMAEGALMMIHDPSTLTWGNAEEHRKSAAFLEKTADVYATVYAARAGIGVDEARALMRAETWFGGSEAVAAGFATEHEESGAPAAMAAAFDYRIYARAPAMLCALSDSRGWRRAAPEERAPGPRAREARMAHDQKAAAAAAGDEKPAATVQTGAPVQMAQAQPAQAPALPAEAVRAMEMAARRSAVMARVGDRLSASQIETVVTNATSVDAACVMAADLVLEAAIAKAGPGPRAVVTGDEGDRRIAAMQDALSVAMFGGELKGPATEYRGLTLKGFAMELSGLKATRHTEIERVKAGMQARGALMASGSVSTSDFTFLTTEVVNRALRAAYAARPATWQRISRQRTATDFRALRSVQFGGDFDMRRVLENGEYQSTVLSDNGEAYAVLRYGREVTLSFEAVINDDLGALGRLPQLFANGAANRQSTLAWGVMNANGNMADGTALFAAGRGNLAGTGAAISVTSVGLARAAMWQQRPLGAVALGGEFISAVPNILAVPPSLEVTALQFATATTPATDATTNPYKGSLDVIVEPRLGAAVTGGSDTVWYLFDSNLPVLEHAYLQGYETPMVEAEENRNPRGITFTAEMMFGVAAVEPRGAYRNPGA